eukprot:SAG31_NODE_268_length_18767_cov_4.644900_10_plen_227_part_00
MFFYYYYYYRDIGCALFQDDIWQDVTLLRAATHCDHMPPASLHSMKAASTKLCWQDSARFQQPQQPRRRRKLRRRSATKHSRSATASSGPAKTRSVAEASDGPPHIAMEAWKQKPIEQQKLNSSEQVTAPSARESTRQSVLPRRQMLLRRGHPWPIQEPHQKALGAAVAERAARLDKRRQEIAFAFQEALGSSRNMQLFCGVLDGAHRASFRTSWFALLLRCMLFL